MAERKLDIRINATEAASPVLDKLSDKLDALKKVGGGRGPLKDVGELLVGGGAIAGFTFLGRVLGDAADGAVKLRDALADGSKSAGEVGEELMKSLPVFGAYFTAGRSIRELLTGEEAATRAILQEAESVNKSIDARIALVKAGTDAEQKHLDTLEKITAELFKQQQPLEDRALFGQKQEGAAALDTINRRAEDDAKKIKDSAAAEQKRLLDEINKTRANMPEAKIIPGSVASGNPQTDQADLPARTKIARLERDRRLLEQAEREAIDKIEAAKRDELDAQEILNQQREEEIVADRIERDKENARKRAEALRQVAEDAAFNFQRDSQKIGEDIASKFNFGNVASSPFVQGNAFGQFSTGVADTAMQRNREVEKAQKDTAENTRATVAAIVSLTAQLTAGAPI